MSEKKDAWDKLNILATVTIAGMVAYWGYIIDARQQAAQAQNDRFERALQELKLQTDARNKDEDQLTHRLAVVTTLMPHISESETSRKVALVALSKLGSEDIAMECSRIFDDESAKSAGDEIQNHGLSDEQGDSPTPTFSALTFDPNNTQSGWMYLGRREGSKWSGNYTELKNSDSVSDLVGKVVTVKQEVSGVNIRAGYPTIFGKLQRTIHTLKPGSEVRIGNGLHYTFNDFIWVTVEYSPPRMDG